MSKLIAAYQLNPTDAKRERLQAYLYAHPMAVCLASPEELQFLKAKAFTF